MTGINIFLADGFEDVEALGTNDVLKRAGIDTLLVSVSDFPLVMSSHNVEIAADCTINDLDINHNGTKVDDFMIFPGGMPGSKTLAENPILIKAMKEHYAAGGSVAAICAAPGLVLSQLGSDILKGLEFTSYDSFEHYLIDKGAIFTPKPAVRSGRIITGRSAGHCLAFGLEILKAIKGEEVFNKVSHDLFLE